MSAGAQILSFAPGRDAVGGLSWRLARKGVPTVAGRRATAVAKLDERIAGMSNASAIGLPTMAELVGRRIDAAAGHVIAIVEAGNAYWVAGYVRGRIEMLSEQVFEEIGKALAAVERRLQSESIDQIACSPEIRADVENFIADRQADAELVAIDYRRRLEGEEPLVTFRRNGGRKGVLAAGAVLALVLGGTFAGVAINFEPEAPVTVERVEQFHEPDWVAFSNACRLAAEAEWPRVLGWEVAAEGCAGPGFDAPVNSDAGGVAWRELKLVSRFDTIIAQRMAERAFADWPHELRFENDRLITALPFEADPVEVSKDAATAPEPGLGTLGTSVENAFAGVRQRIETDVHRGRPRVTVRARTSMSDALRRFLVVPDADLTEFEVAGEIVTLTIVPRTVTRSFVEPMEVAAND